MVTADSFKYALNGLRYVLSKERNARVHLTFAVMVMVVGFVFYVFFPSLKLSIEEVAALTFSIILVFISEIINTALERTVDFFPKVGRPKDIDEHVGIVKDVMAGAVLISATLALVLGVVIFLPRIIQLIQIVSGK